MTLLPGTIDHDDEAKPDSRGLYADPYAEAKPAALSLLHIAGGYLAAPDAPTAPCYVCGKEQPVVMTLLEPPYAICPAREQDECLERGLAKLAAERGEAEAQAGPEAEAAPEEPEAAEKRPRPSRARKAVVSEASKTAAEGTADSAPVPPAGQETTGDAA